DACLLMVPAKDTIKVVEKGQVMSTLKRESLMIALTPQCFKTALIKECTQKAKRDGAVVTDDASIVEMYGDRPVEVVCGSYANIKITTPDDLK
ncbi:MAG TPA: 2-C-methyl-D-erythritol 4-phosphate cytidylyltransferase, partial [Dielma fastidiosa]|nr:2-C-methyl-D-erythritol 4-phosphate cytidylyltransferase [Dielma fastidiosa]